jgi:hypothetical protein
MNPLQKKAAEDELARSQEQQRAQRAASSTFYPAAPFFSMWDF